MNSPHMNAPMTASMPDRTAPYLANLNPAQMQAVRALDGPVLVLAGAGTGKTRVLTTRLAHLLHSGKAWPSQVLAVTFTNKAAQEMRERVAQLMGGPDGEKRPVEGWWLGTFHALAARMLRRHAELAGLSPNFTIIDPDDQVRLMKQIMEGENIDVKKNPPKFVIAQIDRWKDKGRVWSDLGQGDAGDLAGGAAVKLYRLYQERLRTVNACDFGDLLLHMIMILRDPKHADVLADYHRRFRYIMVDEYQDTNVAQYMWLRLLAQGSNNICCVGDDDQSIYGWRGAEVGNILRFEKDFPGAQIIRLEQNYRSTGHILGAAGGVIAHNEDRLGKTLWSEAGDGEKITVRGLWDGPSEARWVGEEIEQLQHKGWRLDQMAVLVRAGFQTREFEERFIQLGLSYKVIGGQRFYERMEIRDALAYFRVTAQPADDLAFERIINTPKRGIGDTTVQTLYSFARAKAISLHEAVTQLVDTDELRPAVRATLKNLLADFARWRGLLEVAAHTEVAAQILEESGYIAMWQGDKAPDAPGRVENLRELVSGMAEYETLPAFLEHVALVLENQDKDETAHVSIMTLHGAKGLEFDAVFLPGWEEGLFPSQKTMDENGLKGLEEERRLAYVGITRARKKAFISFAANRLTYGNWVSALPSRFVDELPAGHVEVQSDSGLYGAGRSQHWDSSGMHAASRTPQRAPERSFDRKVTNDAGDEFSRGTRVMHNSFGAGTVVHVDGHKLDIKFDRGGNKRVMDSFVTVIGD
jgi:DNA helicase-2/ATP-dependent DNA helicase PcrA